MKKSTSLRMLLRSPVKTAVTLVLIAAASFLFLYNLLDYAMTKREYDRNYSQYHGYLSLMHPEDRLVDTVGSRFFYSDPEANPAWKGQPAYELYHLSDLDGAELEALTVLPYVSRVEKRYVTGGISTYPRRYTYNSNLSYDYTLNTSRVILEATYDGTVEKLDKLNLASMIQMTVDLKLKDVKVLAGDGELLEQSRDYINKRRLCVELSAWSPERVDETYHSVSHWVTLGGYTQNWISLDTILGLEKGQRYVMVASVTPFQASSSGILDEDHTYTLPYTHMGDDSFYGICEYFTPLAGEPENYLETEKFAGIRQMMEIIDSDRYTLDVHYLEEMQSLKCIQEGQLQSTRGRLLTREDAENRNPVCVIPEGMAQAYGLELGDSLYLELGDKLLEKHAFFGSVAFSPRRWAEHWKPQSFTIVGTYTESDLFRLGQENRLWAYGENAVFVPLSFLPETADTEDHTFKPTEISLIIDDADSIVPFRDEVLPSLLEAGYVVYFSDGGWPAVREQMGQAGSLSLVKLCAFGVSAVLVMLLTVYLYILRKKKEYAIMRALGCPARQARGALLFPLLALALPAVLLGSLGAVVYTRRAAEANAAEFAAMGLTMDSAVPLDILALGFCGSLVLLLVLAFLALVRVAHKPPLELLQGETNRNGNRRKNLLPPEPAGSAVYADLPELPEPVYRSHTAVSHTLRYVGKHLRRTPVKSLLAVLLALVLAFSIGFFTLLRSTYRDLYQNIEVHPRFLNGFTNNRAMEVAKSGYVKDPYYEYTNRNCESNFVQDTLILTSDISRVTEAEIIWREDKGPEMFSENKGFVVISRDLADTLGYELGSRLEICGAGWIIYLMSSYPHLTYEELVDQVYHKFSHKFTVAGIAEEEGMKVYASIFAWEHFGSMFSDYVPLDKAEFTLVDYHKATEFRSWVFRLMVGRTGSFSMETREADRIYQTYRLLETLYPIAFALALALGGVLPAGIILQGAKEASLLRVLGTTKRRTRAMLTLEQIFLCFLGLCLAIAALVLSRGSALTAVAGLVAAYAAAHLLACTAGTEAAAVSVTRRNVLELLQVKE